MSIEQDLLKAADELEKIAMECEEPMKEEMSAKDYKKEEKKESKKEEKKESKEHEKEESMSEEEKEEYAEKMASLKEELGIDSELAEKVASADPSVVEYIKNLRQEPADTMGEEDTREKTASDEESCPLGDFMSTPL